MPEKLKTRVFLLQTPGAALGSWAFLGALLDSTTRDFKFLEPLGKSREVKTALSGLFGRFVARAYATKCLGYTHFAHIHNPPMPLSFGGGLVERVAPRDLPDWATWSGSKGLAIIEAKGSHDWTGPAKTLARAYTQAQRVKITIGGRVAPFKSYAIATGWGFAALGPSRPMLWVKDPNVDGDGIPEAFVDRLGFGIAQRPCAALLKPLGFRKLSDALLGLAEAQSHELFEQAQGAAREALSEATSRRLSTTAGAAPPDELIGAFVTRAGPVGEESLSGADQEVLGRLRMRPTFVGIERSSLEAVIDGAASKLRSTHAFGVMAQPEGETGAPRTDGAGTWLFRPDDDEGQLEPPIPGTG